MSLVCDRCEETIESWGVKARVSEHYKATQPGNPHTASEHVDHLCLDCSEDYREFIDYQ